MNTSDSAMKRNNVIRIIFAICGWFMVVSGTLYLLTESDSDSSAVLGGLIVLEAGVYLVYCGHKRKKLIEDYSEYMLLLSEDKTHSLYYISARKNIPIDDVRKNLWEMMEKKLLGNAMIDDVNNRVVFYSEMIDSQQNNPTFVMPQEASNIDYKEFKAESINEPPSFCNGCGARLMSDSKFCSKCGKPIGIPFAQTTNSMPIEPTRTVPNRGIISSMFTCPECGSYWIRTSYEEETETIRIKDTAGAEIRYQFGGCFYWLFIGWWWWLCFGWWIWIFKPVWWIVSGHHSLSGTRKKEITYTTRVYTCKKCGHVWRGRTTRSKGL